MSFNLKNSTQFIFNGTANEPVISGHTAAYTDNTQYATGATIQVNILNQINKVITTSCIFTAVNVSGTTSNLITVSETGLVTIIDLDIEDGTATIIATIDGNVARYTFENLLT